MVQFQGSLTTAFKFGILTGGQTIAASGDFETEDIFLQTSWQSSGRQHKVLPTRDHKFQGFLVSKYIVVKGQVITCFKGHKYLELLFGSVFQQWFLAFLWRFLAVI